MAKFEEAINRNMKNVFVCRRCKTKIRTTMAKVLRKKTSCRKCKSNALRPVRKGKKV
ncbi:MAG: 50S ribosomal protein L40e [Candidatus Nanoarchaeia archaeon]|nr:50S ribosomal protein L40e [Candidatus Nanoarchaeia archaeon]